MARLALGRDEQGVVYVEFLLAFFPVFLLFLGICQLALLGTAGAVVRHATYAAARSAIVVLEEARSRYDSAAGREDGPARGDVSHGTAPPTARIGALLAAVGVPSLGPELEPAGTPAASGEPAVRQQGARMAPIRTAAYMPLLVLAPKTGPDGAHAPSLAASLPSELGSALGAALAYTESATVVTLHTRAGTEALAPEPIAPNATLTVRVSYLYQCSVPLVRELLCRSLKALTEPAEPASGAGEPAAALADRLRLAEAPGALATLAGSGALFYVLRGEVTLPNQGAAYDHPGGS